MEGEPTVVADSGSEVQAAPSVAAGPTDSTHGEQAEQATTPETDAVESTPPADEDDPETEPSDSDTEEEAKSKAQLRRERRQAREQDRIDRAVEERFAARERERSEQAAAEKREADARAAQETWHKEFGALVGTPEQRSALDAEIRTLTAEVTAMRPYADGTDLDALEAKQAALSAKIAERGRLDEAAESYRKLDEFQFKQTQDLYARRAAGMPPEHQKAYLASTDIATALARLEDGIEARERAKADARVAAVEAEWRGKYEREAAAHAATRTGAPGAGPAPNGANGTGSAGVRTRQDFLALPRETKDRMRREQPSLVAEIYARSA